MKKKIYWLTILLAFSNTVFAQTKPVVGDGTENSPLEISTIDELRYFVGLVNGTLEGVDKDSTACAILTTDLDLSGENGIESWTPIGNQTYYSGCFDGKGHSISNIVVEGRNNNNLGTFGLCKSATIKNIELINIQVNSGYKNSGGLAGYTCQSSFTNCKVSGTISASSYTGGILGRSVNCSVDNCHNSATIKAYDETGGIIGFCEKTTISNCSNSGNIPLCDQKGNEKGGIVGGMYDTSSVVSCYNTGKVSAHWCCGGIEGYSKSCKISKCHTTGDISGVSYIGGIGGSIDASDLSNCYNSGKISGSDTGAGGIAGETTSTKKVTSCYNIGEIKGKSYYNSIIGVSMSTEKKSCFFLSNCESDY